MKKSYNKIIMSTLFMVTMTTAHATQIYDPVIGNQQEDVAVNQLDEMDVIFPTIEELEVMTDEEIKVLGAKLEALAENSEGTSDEELLKELMRGDQITLDAGGEPLDHEQTMDFLGQDDKIPTAEELDAMVDQSDDDGSSSDGIPSEEELDSGIAAQTGSQKSSGADNFSHAVLILPSNPENKEAWNKTITSQKDWESFFYAQTAAMSFLEGQAPVAGKFDFDKYQVLTGGLGERSSGGYSLIVESVIESEDAIEILVLEIRPDASCTVPFSISYPTTTVLIKKTDKPFKITVSNLVDECLN